MKIFKIYLTLVVFSFLSVHSFAQNIIESTAQGGSWEATTTWVEGVIPAATDNVIINGPVTIGNATLKVKNLTINSEGSLSGWVSVQVSENFINHGFTSLDNGNFSLSIAGNVENYGELKVYELKFTSTNQYISNYTGGLIDANNISITTVNSVVIANTDLTLYGSFYLGQGTLDINGHKLELMLAGEIRNGVITNATEISMPDTEGDVSGGLNNVTIETNTVNLYNHLRISGLTTFNGDVIVHDTLTTFGGGYTGGKTLNVNGTLINNGDVFVMNIF